jgi:hypothetical protein
VTRQKLCWVEMRKSMFGGSPTSVFDPTVLASWTTLRQPAVLLLCFGVALVTFHAITVIFLPWNSSILLSDSCFLKHTWSAEVYCHINSVCSANPNLSKYPEQDNKILEFQGKKITFIAWNVTLKISIFC